MFLAQCSLIFELQPSYFPSGLSKIAYLITMMSGRALTVSTAVWELQPAIYASLEGFMGEVRKIFDAPFSRQEAARRLIQLRQDSRSVADYVVDFHTLAESAWNPEALLDMLMHGVSEEVKDELAARELPTDLDSLIALTIRIDWRLQERQRERKFEFAFTPRDPTLLPNQPRSSRRSRY